MSIDEIIIGNDRFVKVFKQNEKITIPKNTKVYIYNNGTFETVYTAFEKSYYFDYGPVFYPDANSICLMMSDNYMTFYDNPNSSGNNFGYYSEFFIDYLDVLGGVNSLPIYLIQPSEMEVA